MKRLKFIPKDPNYLLMILLGLWCILNICQGVFTELANDESYYWFITGDLSWGYFDHPPVFGLLTWLGVNIFGDSEIGVRIFTILLQPLYLYLFWTVVRTEKSDWKSALIYFLVAFSIPQLQLYGWVVTPDAPLLMSTAVILWSYNRFKQKNDIISALLMGAGVALMAYSKYQGALVVVFLIASDIKLLRQWKVWLAAGFAALLILPHILWQYEHDWVSFRYHLSDRNGEFSWGDTLEYILNVIVTFHPFIFIPYAIYSFKRKAMDQMDRTLRIISWGFIFFFLASNLRGYVQPQWVIPAVFSILYTITRSAERYIKFQKYILYVGYISGALFFIFRIFVMSYSGDAIRAEIFNNREVYSKLADQLDGRTLITDGHYAESSKLNYYSNGMAYAYPSMYRRSSHYQMMDIDKELYGKKVAVAINSKIWETVPRKTLDSTYLHFNEDRYFEVYYDTVNFFIPTRFVEMSYRGLPTNTLTGRPITLTIDIHNPYSYDIPLDDFILIGQFKMGRSYWREVEIPFKNLKVLEAGSTNQIKAEFMVPVMDTGKYKFGLSLQRLPATSWYNSPRYEIQVTNPAQKRGY